MITEDTPWENLTIVAFDTETSGAYPLGYEIVEMGAVKWRAGQVIETFEALIKPTVPMTDFIIKIHGITNQMVADAPPMNQVIGKFHQFLGDSVLMAHHAPFDLGFLTYEFEKAGLTLPNSSILCSSLLARALIREAPNHKLQTLIPLLKIPQGAAHRAYDDAKACLEVGLESLRRFGAGKSIKEINSVMGKPLTWNQYRILTSGQSDLRLITQAVTEKKDLDLIYQGGSAKGTRRVTPIGLVRNPDGDFLFAKCHLDQSEKRFYLGKIKDLALVF